jgi:hypothetical protein
LFEFGVQFLECAFSLAARLVQGGFGFDVW